MHAEAYDWVRQHAMPTPGLRVLDIGGRDINGSTRPLFPGADWTVLDIAPGANVHIVADAATWVPEAEYDVVVCTEVFEHTPHWPQIVATAFKACAANGRLIVTMAGPGRPPHSAVDGGWSLHPGEHYANIPPERLRTILEQVGWCDVVIDQQPSPADVRAVARKP
jgi:hypothetical protein